MIERYAGRADVVFTSEAYGDELARRLGSRHVCIDPARETFSVSGTAIRNDPLANWNFIPRIVRPTYAHRVAILGAESTGKTTLAARLAAEFDTSWAPEYGRAYCEGRDPRDLSLDEFDVIARGQIEVENAAAAMSNRVVICDTDIRTTATWSELIRGTRSEWLARAASTRRYSHALLLAADVPWVNDGTRVLRAQRALHTQLLEEELTRTGQAFTRIEGSFDERFLLAVEIVGRVLASPVMPDFDAAS